MLWAAFLVILIVVINSGFGLMMVGLHNEKTEYKQPPPLWIRMIGHFAGLLFAFHTAPFIALEIHERWGSKGWPLFFATAFFVVVPYLLGAALASEIGFRKQKA